MERSKTSGLTRRALLRGASALGAAAMAAPPAWGLAAPAAQADTADALEPKLAHDPRRPQFHLLPAKNWMNDPNGPMYWNGEYHMFFQYNPHAAVWGDMSWNHAVSPDMLHWKHLPVALTPTPGTADAYGVFSGSALAVDKRVYQVYTGTRLSSKELATLRDGEDKIQESQCLAYSDDPSLVTWTKLPEPVIPLPPKGMQVTGFRDPSAWKQGDGYYMTVGSGEARVGGCVLLYRSHDLRQWEYLHKLTGGHWNGKPTPNPCDDGEMWECPDFFALDGGHVLIYSTLGKVIWESGRLDEATMTFKAEKTGELDLGAFYAPKTQLDARGRRILWGWIQEKRTDDQLKQAGWAGMMSLPRLLRLSPDGVLRTELLPETRKLRSARLALEPVGAGAVTVNLPEANGEVLCGGGTPGASFTLTMTQQGTPGGNEGGSPEGSQEGMQEGSREGATAEMRSEILKVTYVPERHALMIDGGREVALAPGEPPAVHGFVDGSVVELILGGTDGGRAGYTRRFYYKGAQAPTVRVRVEGPGARMMAWRVLPISSNRLTTTA